MNTAAKINLSLKTIALGTVGLLCIPFVAMQFTEEVNWSAIDFIIMGTLIFSAGMILRFLMSRAIHLGYRIGIVLAVGTTFLMIWANLAVGLIGSGPNLANLMYIGVIAIGIAGAFITQFSKQGMERTMYAMILGLILHSGVAWLSVMPENSRNSVKEILIVNGFFGFLYLCAALAFRRHSSN